MLGAFLAKTHDTQGKLLKDNSTATQAHQQNHCITANPPKLGRVIQNSWYDEECHDTRRCLQREVTQGIYTQTSKSSLSMPHKEEEEIVCS